MNFFDLYEGAIFDLDGTLADSMGLWEEIDREWLRRQGRSVPEGFSGLLRNMSVTQSAEYVKNRFSLGLSPEEIIRQWTEMALEKYRNDVPLKPGAAELLALLRRRGMKLALATSCFPDACEGLLARRRIRDYFEAILYTNDFRGPGGEPLDKSSPLIWLAAAESLGLAPEKCVVFEDLYAALKGARSAGMGFIGVYDAAAPDWPLLAAEADRAVYSLADLPQVRATLSKEY